MQTTTNNTVVFIQNIQKSKAVNLQTKKLFIHVVKNRCPYLFTVNYYFRKRNEWVKYSTFTTEFVPELLEDAKQEIKFYNN